MHVALLSAAICRTALLFVMQVGGGWLRLPCSQYPVAQTGAPAASEDVDGHTNTHASSAAALHCGATWSDAPVGPAACRRAAQRQPCAAPLSPRSRGGGPIAIQQDSAALDAIPAASCRLQVQCATVSTSIPSQIVGARAFQLCPPRSAGRHLATSRSYSPTIYRLLFVGSPTSTTTRRRGLVGLISPICPSSSATSPYNKACKFALVFASKNQRDGENASERRCEGSSGQAVRYCAHIHVYQVQRRRKSALVIRGGDRYAQGRGDNLGIFALFEPFYHTHLPPFVQRLVEELCPTSVNTTSSYPSSPTLLVGVLHGNTARGTIDICRRVCPTPYNPKVHPSR